jgi:hypothetical protein
VLVAQEDRRKGLSSRWSSLGGHVLGLTPWGALTLTSALLAAAVFVHRASSREPDRFVARVLILGFVVKLVASGAYYFFLTGVYEGGDSFLYVRVGGEIAEQLRSGAGIPESAWETGTRSMEFISGVLFAVTQPTVVHGFVLFALLAYLGAYLALRGFSIAFPDGDRRRYAMLIMLTPTMLFWPSSISKDSWLVFGLGVGIYGVARVYRRLRGGYLLLLAATAAIYLVRPHMAALFALAAAVGFSLRFRDEGVRRGATAWIIGMVIVSSSAGYALATYDEFLPQDENVHGTRLDQVLGAVERQTRLGGSEFESRPVETPLDLGYALITVPFRPFPNETNNVQALLSSLEGLVFLGLFVLSLGRLRRLPQLLLRRPFVAFATAYSLGFIVAFANIGNFGILVRQRTQLLPLFFVLVCLPPAARAAKKRRQPALTAARSTPSQGL